MSGVCFLLSMDNFLKRELKIKAPHANWSTPFVSFFLSRWQILGDSWETYVLMNPLFGCCFARACRLCFSRSSGRTWAVHAAISSPFEGPLTWLLPFLPLSLPGSFICLEQWNALSLKVTP